MDKKERITQIVFSAIDQVNQQLTDDEKITKAWDTVLMGQSSALDSLGLVNLIVAVEEGVQDGFGETVTLANETAIISDNSPFNNIRSLVTYIDQKIKD